MTIQQIEQRRKNKKQNLEFLKNNEVVIEKQYKTDLVKSINGYKIGTRMGIMEGLYEELLKKAIEKRNLIIQIRKEIEKLSDDFDKIDIILKEEPYGDIEGSIWFIKNKEKENRRNIFYSFSKIERIDEIKSVLQKVLKWDFTKVYIDIDNGIYVRPTEEFWNSIENKTDNKPYIYKSIFQELADIENPVEELLGMIKRDYLFQENIRKLKEMKDITIPKYEFPYNKTRWISFKGKKFVYDYFDRFYADILYKEDGAEKIYNILVSRYEKGNQIEVDIEKTLKELNKTYKCRYGTVAGEYGTYYSFYYKNHLIKRIFAYSDREHLLHLLKNLLKEIEDGKNN